MPRVRVRQHIDDFHRPPNLVVAYPWFDRADYVRARRMMIDGDLWPTDYEIWQREAVRAIESLAAEGVCPIRARVDPDAFAEWCRVHDCAADSGARLAYAEMVALDRDDVDGP